MKQNRFFKIAQLPINLLASSIWSNVLVIFVIFATIVGCSVSNHSDDISPNSNTPLPPKAEPLANPASSLAGIKEKGVIVIGTAITQPFEYYDPDTQALIGLDVDIAKSIADQLGVEIQWVEMPFANLLPALEDQKVDMTIAAMYITPERESVVDFSQPYLETGLIMVIHPDIHSGIHQIDDIVGLNVGVKIGATGEALAQNLVSEGMPLNITQYKNTLDSLLDLEVGRIDVVFNDYLNTLFYIKEYDSNIRIVANTDNEVTFLSHTGLGIAVNQQNDTLLNEINKILKGMQQDDMIEECQNKWFSSSNNQQ